MIRNLMKTLLCLMLALMLPLAACADTQHTLSVIPGDELASIEPLKDFLDVFSITLTTGEKSGALTLTLDDTDIATVALSADESGLYVQSNLLSDDVLYATWDEIFDALRDTLKTAITSEAAANGEEADEEALAAIDTMMDVYKVQFAAALSGAEDKPAAAQSQEDVMAMVKEMFGDDPEMVAFYEKIFDLMTIEEGEFADEGRDTATGKYSMVMTGKDIALICDTQYMRSLTETMVKAENAELEGAELEAKVDEMLAEIRRVYEDSDMTITMEMFTTDEGQTLVGMVMGMNMEMTENDETVKMEMNMNYDRLTGENGVSHKADMSMVVDADDDTVEMAMNLNYDRTNGKDGVMHKADFSVSGKDSVTDGEMMKAELELVNGQNGVSDGSLAILVNEEQVTFVYHGEDVDATRQRSLAIYNRDNAAAIIAPAASDRPLLTFVLTSGEADGARLSAIEEATPETAVSVMKLSVEEVKELLNDATVRLNQAIFLGMSKLPASVLEMLGVTGGSNQ